MKNRGRKILTDLDSFKLFYQQYQKEYFAVAFALLKDKLDAEDLIQECFVTLLDKKKDWSEIDNVQRYMQVILRNKCCNKLDKRKSERRRFNILSDHRQTEILTNYDPMIPEKMQLIDNEKVIHHNEKIIHYTLSLLPPQRQMAVILAYVVGFSRAMTAELMGLSPETVKTHLTLARKFLTERFSREIIGVLILMLIK